MQVYSSSNTFIYVLYKAVLSHLDTLYASLHHLYFSLSLTLILSSLSHGAWLKRCNSDAMISTFTDIFTMGSA